jgi:uncharacterized membrane protein
MGKPLTRTIHVPRAVTILLLITVSLAMAATVAWLSGRAYLREKLTAEEVVSLVHRYDTGGMSSSALLASVAPAIADVLFFIPWGALAFLAFDAGEGRRLRTWVVTLAVGVTFALGLVVWQSALPTRVTGSYDAAWQTLGCAVGALAGHLRKRVRLRFE